MMWTSRFYVYYSCVKCHRSLVTSTSHFTSMFNASSFSSCNVNGISLGLSKSFISSLKDVRLFCSGDSRNDLKPSSLVKSTISDKPKKKKALKTYISLIGIDQSPSITTMEEASKLATRRNYKLVKVIDCDPKSGRAVYQLMTESQYLKEDSEWDDSKTKKEKSIKGDKLVSFSSNIKEHDIETKVKMMKKWLAKRFEVRVVITGDIQSGEMVYKAIEKFLGTEGRIVQKRAKATDIRFQINPPKIVEAKSSGDQTKMET